MKNVKRLKPITEKQSGTSSSGAKRGAKRFQNTYERPTEEELKAFLEEENA